MSCGDGFNARNFYSAKVRKIIASDINPITVNAARKKNAAPNLEYRVVDVRNDLPDQIFDNVIWDFAFPITEYFSHEEINKIYKNIKSRLSDQGIFSGYTMAKDNDSDPSFATKGNLYNLLKPFFKNITIFETKTPGRLNLYFFASDGIVPFQKEWKSACTNT